MLSRDLMITAPTGSNGRLIIRPPAGRHAWAGVRRRLGAALLASFLPGKMAWWKRSWRWASPARGYRHLSEPGEIPLMVAPACWRSTPLRGPAAESARSRCSLTGVAGGAGAGDPAWRRQHPEPVRPSFRKSHRVYYKSRGTRSKPSNNVLWDYPLGAGLARWGVMSGYLGVSPSKQISAEVQPHAWILDGGILLLLAYGLALVSTVAWELKLVLRLPDPEDRLWAAAVVAANVGTLALVFTFVPFATQIGIQFWFLEGLLHGAMTMKLAQWR